MNLIFIFLILTFACALQAAPYSIFVAEVPPLLEKDGEGVRSLSGLFGKIITEKIDQAGKAAEFDIVWVPWKRAINETQKNKNGLFFPLARTVERENDFCWLGHLGKVESWFYAKDPKVKIDTFNDLKKYRIGFLSGSQREHELRKILGEDAKNMDGMTEDFGNYKKLVAGRIEIWAAQTEVFESAQKKYNAENPKNTTKVNAIKKFLDQEVWIVSNIKMNEKLQKNIRDIFKNKTKCPFPNAVATP